MPTTQHPDGSESSQLKAICDAYGGNEPSPTISERLSEPVCDLEAGKSVVGPAETERKKGIKRTAAPTDIETDVLHHGLKTTEIVNEGGVGVEGSHPHKKKKRDNDDTVTGDGGEDVHSQTQESTVDQSADQDAVCQPPPPQVPSVPGENVEVCVKRINTENRQLLNKWKESFLEGEAFESFCPSRMDALLKEARILEENLKEQKDALKNRLQQIARTLEMLS